MHKLRITLLLFTMLVCFSCAHAPERPEWISGKIPAKYPDARFLSATGQAGDAQTAKDRARLEIAKQIRVTVSQDYSVNRQESSWLDHTNIQDITRTSVNETLQGVEIRELFEDTNTGQVHALAVLERKAAAVRLQKEVVELDGELKTRMRIAGQANDALKKLGPLLQARDLMQQRNVKNDQLAVINISGRGVDADTNLTEIDAELDRTLAAIKVVVQVNGADSARITQAIVRSLNNGHLNVQQNESGASLAIRGEIREIATDKANQTEFVFAKMRATIHLVNMQDGATFATIEHELRDGAKSYADARRKVLDRLSEAIVSDFNTRLYQYLSL